MTIHLENEIERLRAENERLKSERNRLHRFAVNDPSTYADEARSLEPGNTAADCQAIDVANRAASFKAKIEEINRLRAVNDHWESRLEQLDSAACDYFKRHGVAFPQGTNFGEYASEMVAEAERLRRRIDRGGDK